MMALLLLTCAPPSPIVGESLTEGGTWLLSLASTRYDKGEATIDVTALCTEEGEPAPDLRIFALPDMEEMEHSPGMLDFQGLGDGGYTTTMRFDMPGLWTLSGYAGDAAGSEAFHFVVEVAP